MHGIAAFNLLTGFGFFEPFWLLDVANITIVVHLVAAYQVFVQPIFAFFERRLAQQRLHLQRTPRGGGALRAQRVPAELASALVCLTTVIA